MSWILFVCPCVATPWFVSLFCFRASRVVRCLPATSMSPDHGYVSHGPLLTLDPRTLSGTERGEALVIITGALILLIGFRRQILSISIKGLTFLGPETQLFSELFQTAAPPRAPKSSAYRARLSGSPRSPRDKVTYVYQNLMQSPSLPAS